MTTRAAKIQPPVAGLCKTWTLSNGTLFLSSNGVFIFGWVEDVVRNERKIMLFRSREVNGDELETMLAEGEA